jgi:geranylgeranyl diphosphate synthase type I
MIHELNIEPVSVIMRRLIGDPAGDPCAEMGRYQLGSGGKMLRARLAVGAARVFGVSGDAAAPWGAACELLHNASLVHDDLQDGDLVRRDRAALWVKYGREQAVNAGDMLLMLAVRAVFLSSAHVGPEIVGRLAECVVRRGDETVRGQSRELRLRADVVMEHAAYIEAAFGKTAGLFGMPVEGAALLAGRSPEQALALARPFERLGLLYQLQDDVIDLYGDKGRGAPGADVREGKISALVVAHVARRPGDRAWLSSVLRLERDEVDDALVAEVARRFDESGALDDVLAEIDALASAVVDPVLADVPGLAAAALGLRDAFLEPLTRIVRPSWAGRRADEVRAAVGC